VECDDEDYEVFGSYVLEIGFKEKPSERGIRGHIQITEQNLKKIRYRVD